MPAAPMDAAVADMITPTMVPMDSSMPLTLSKNLNIYIVSYYAWNIGT